MHELAGIFFFLLTALICGNANSNHRDGKPAPEYPLVPPLTALDEAGNATVLHPMYPRQESLICSAGSRECVGHCCVGKSCCAHGVVPCCLSGAVCQVFNQAPLCCVQGINCGTPSGTSTTPVITSTASAPTTSAASNSAFPTNSTTIASTIIHSSHSDTSSPTAVALPATDNNGKLAQSDKIALAVGIVVGVPSALCALIQMWRWSTGKK